MKNQLQWNGKAVHKEGRKDDRLFVNGRPVPRPPRSTELAVENDGGIAFSEHKRRTCHWPVGETGDGELKMCGDTIAAGAYCVKHAAVAYARQPTEKRKSFWER